MSRQQLTDREHRLLSEWVAERLGIRFGPEKRDILRSRLDGPRAELGFDTFEQLYFHLKFHPERDSAWQRLVPHLTNNESYFFREPAQLEALRTEVLPLLREEAQRAGRRDLRLLSAGCASGEEAYTLAVIARDSGLFPPPWDVRVTGMDVDEAALCRARQGSYGENAFRRIAAGIRARYFTEAPDGRSELLPEVRSMANFRRGNLIEPGSYSGIPPQDVVFCRNVLIYFGEESTRTAVEGLARVLRPGGYLFLGHAESLSRIPTALVPERRPGAVYYRRPPAGNG